jgi:Flp pilus assembly protein TadB
VLPVVVFLGAVAGFGLTLLIAALRPAPPAEQRPARRSPVARRRLDNRLGLLNLRLVLGVVFGVIVGLVTRWPVAALFCAAGGFMLPSFLGGRDSRAREVARIEAIASWAEMLRDTLAGAGGLEQSIVASAGVAPEPIRPEVMRLAARLDHDRLSVALRDFADDLDDPIGDLVVASLVLAADRSPKRLGNLLGTLADSARSEADMRLRVDAGRARTRTSVRVVTITTIVFTLGLVFLNRSYLEVYGTVLGQMVLLFIGLLYTAAFLWLARAARFRASERFLTTERMA